MCLSVKLRHLIFRPSYPFTLCILCRFPKAVPWVHYHGNYKDLKINIVCPGKDTALGE